LGYSESNILIIEQNLAAQDGIASLWEASRFNVMVTMGILMPFFRFHPPEFFNLFHPRGRKMIIDVGIVAGKALSAKEFFGIESAVRFAKLCMSFGGNLPQTMIGRHFCILLTGWEHDTSCS
jgi:hypothetical protein